MDNTTQASPATFKVKASGNVKKIAGAIIGELENNSNKVELSCIGAGSVNQAVKSTIIARQALFGKAINTSIDLGFRDIGEGVDQKSSVILVVSKV